MLSRRWFNVAVFAALVLATLSLSGCIKVEVIDRTPSTPNTVQTKDNRQVADHDLAVLAVDFDPPLEYEEIVARKNRGEGITLLVAIENTGAKTEKEVTVEVTLSKDGGQTVFLQKTGTIDVIAPGEIKIAHFEDTDIPFSYAYLLRVRVLSVAGETRVSDNQKTYDLLVTQP